MNPLSRTFNADFYGTLAILQEERIEAMIPLIVDDSGCLIIGDNIQGEITRRLASKPPRMDVEEEVTTSFLALFLGLLQGEIVLNIFGDINCQDNDIAFVPGAA
jgi:hypothetical protein